jgi:hypothetical protein
MSKKQTTTKKAVVKTIKPIESETYNKNVEETKEVEFEGNLPLILRPTLGSKAKENRDSNLDATFNDFLNYCRGKGYRKQEFEEAAWRYFDGSNLSFRYSNPRQCYLSVDGKEFSSHIQIG